MSTRYRTRVCHVLVIGAGGAGVAGDPDGPPPESADVVDDLPGLDHQGEDAHGSLVQRLSNLRQLAPPGTPIIRWNHRDDAYALDCIYRPRVR